MSSMINMSHKLFCEIDINDSFFDTLKKDYPGFESWYERKGNEDAYVQYDENKHVIGFLYLKTEENEVNDVEPKIRAKRICKVGTFKIEAHKTKLGERFIKIIMDYAVNEAVELCYVTIFDKHKGLIDLLKRYGFKLYGTKKTGESSESVYIKDMNYQSDDINKTFPKINVNGKRKFLLAIYPKYHSIMFPDSILKTENSNIISDVSYTNSIHKIYVCNMLNVESMKYGDIVVLYRTAEKDKPAEYSAVATSICVVEEVKLQNEFDSFNSFYEYVSQYSVFDRADLKRYYNKGGCKAIKLTYNAALIKRIVRHDLIEKIGLDRNAYWGFFEMTNEQFLRIANIGGVSNKLMM